jgi:hypothetical protein
MCSCAHVGPLPSTEGTRHPAARRAGPATAAPVRLGGHQPPLPLLDCHHRSHLSPKGRPRQSGASGTADDEETGDAADVTVLVKNAVLNAATWVAADVLGPVSDRDWTPGQRPRVPIIHSQAQL